MDKTMLISIKPKYTKKIFRGEKNFELRKTYPKAHPGMIAIIYASSPKSSLVGHFTIGKIIKEDKKKLWDKYQEQFGISYAEYNLYFKDYISGVAIEIIDPVLWKKERALTEIKKYLQRFCPPQSYSFISRDHPLFHFLKTNI